MTLKRENNHSNEISVFKLGKNEVLHKILGLFFQSLIFNIWPMTAILVLTPR